MSRAPQTAAMFNQVAAAREDVMTILDRLRSAGDGAGPNVDAIVALQAAANQLGAAEEAIGPPAGDVPEAPAPILGADDAPPDPGVAFSGEATAVLALAEYTVPYAATSAEAAECWLRALRREGVVARALAELGFPAVQLAPRAEPRAVQPRCRSVESVRKKAGSFARQRRADSVTTTDVLFAVLAIHKRKVDRALYEFGINRGALLDRVAGGDRALARMGAASA